jgi:aryl-alcohol dehydrogenase-like predicted oxidoreductase
MEYLKVKGIEKPVSKLIMGTAWFDPSFEDEIFQMMDTYVEAGGTVIDTGRFYGIARSEKILTGMIPRFQSPTLLIAWKPIEAKA